MVMVSDVIKKMRAEGMTREQIIESLTELGFPNADALYDKYAGGAPAPKPVVPTPKPFGLAEAAEKEEEKEEEKKEANASGGEEKPLFGQQTPRKEESEIPEERESGRENKIENETEGNEAEEKQPEKETEKQEAPQSEELPELNITQVGDDGLEKTVSIEDMLTKASGPGSTTQNAGGSGGAGGSISSAAANDPSLRQKLAETNALLRALADVNKKILETDREVLMRLKAKETKEPQSEGAAKSQIKSIELKSD